MSESQFETLLATVKSMESKFDKRFDSVENRLDQVEVELVGIKGELKRLEHWTPYNANQDTVTKLAAINGRK
ncbi:hypothetical protein [Chitinophaga sp. CF418]|uniref:hypothetical protein n=1 Tax=Chitinophaga sp. CF418 TaxID=1855287 RepID=UPI00092207BF|nr:hypothetical protein [Chitinophaga sp. CF418]SHM01253.1 hypothetical protein SAMN05216311_101380 [Chitinophaga sp. CF418]